ncbi:MAG: SURF1 family protein [Casimicrobiaceae bacterium]|nr:SURF1 family protein [Casimicrobiaceae bacterium]
MRGMSVRATAYRFRPTLWALGLTLCVVALTVWLGHWQGERAAYKLAQRQALEAARNLPPLSPAEASRLDTPERFRAVRGAGRFVGERLWFLDNRISQGRAGYAVLQLFEPDVPPDQAGQSPRLILVDRGWIAVGPDRSRLPSIQVPVGPVTIEGRINRPPSRPPGSADNTPGASLLNYLALEEIERELGRPLAPFIVELVGGDGWLGTPPPDPAVRVEHHYAYQLQWYALALLAVILFFVFSLRRVETDRAS